VQQHHAFKNAGQVHFSPAAAQKTHALCHQTHNCSGCTCGVPVPKSFQRRLVSSFVMLDKATLTSISSIPSPLQKIAIVVCLCNVAELHVCRVRKEATRMGCSLRGVSGGAKLPLKAGGARLIRATYGVSSGDRPDLWMPYFWHNSSLTPRCCFLRVFKEVSKKSAVVWYVQRGWVET